MLNLETKVPLSAANIKATNLTSLFPEGELNSIGAYVLAGYKADQDSRSGWLKRMESALNLAIQLQEGKSFPWQGCSNVKFPLVAIAALQWASRAYPLLLQGPDIVKTKVLGDDPTGEKMAKAVRVSKFMSYQLQEEDESWEEESDRLLINLPILGCGFKKSRYDSTRGHNTSEFVSAKDLVLNYWAKSVEDCDRKTHVIPLSRNTLWERAVSGVFADVTTEDWFKAGVPAPTPPQGFGDRADQRNGQSPPPPDDSTPFQCLEQHVRIDLDQDGYAEPYIITVEETSGRVLRMVINCSESDIVRVGARIASIREERYFTKFSFIPNPDGGVYDLGFGVLLGPLNESVNSLINQLIDAGTLATTAGGFLGRGVKIRGGEYAFRPFGWQRVDSTGEDLSKGVFPFPVRDPSAVLFNLLSLLIDYTNRMSGSTDIMVGENPGQNTPAQTSQLMAEQGAKVNTAIFKRVWRGFRDEFQKLYLLNRKYVSVSGTTYGEQTGMIKREDFSGPENGVRPAADPNLSSDTARVQQAMTVKQLAAGGGYDPEAVERNLLRAMKVENVDELFKGYQAFPPPGNPKVAQENVKQQSLTIREKAKHDSRLKEKLMTLLAEKDKLSAETELLRAQTVALISGIGAEKAAVDDAKFSQHLKLLQHNLEATKAADESIRGYLELAQGNQENDDGSGESDGGGLPGMGDPSGDAGAATGPGQ